MSNTTVTIENVKYSTALYNYDKRDNYFNILNFPCLSSNIPSGPAYGVNISQLGRICSSYTRFTMRHYKLNKRLVFQGFRYSALCVAFRIYGFWTKLIMVAVYANILKMVYIYQQWIHSIPVAGLLLPLDCHSLLISLLAGSFAVSLSPLRPLEW